MNTQSNIRKVRRLHIQSYDEHRRQIYIQIPENDPFLKDLEQWGRVYRQYSDWWTYEVDPYWSFRDVLDYVRGLAEVTE